MGGGNARAGAMRAALEGDPPAIQNAIPMRRQPPRGLALTLPLPPGTPPRRWIRPLRPSAEKQRTWGPDRDHAAVGAARSMAAA
jgi:hypothetical protein